MKIVYDETTQTEPEYKQGEALINLLNASSKSLEEMRKRWTLME